MVQVLKMIRFGQEASVETLGAPWTTIEGVKRGHQVTRLVTLAKQF